MSLRVIQDKTRIDNSKVNNILGQKLTTIAWLTQHEAEKSTLSGTKAIPGFKLTVGEEQKFLRSVNGNH